MLGVEDRGVEGVLVVDRPDRAGTTGRSVSICASFVSVSLGIGTCSPITDPVEVSGSRAGMGGGVALPYCAGGAWPGRGGTGGLSG